MPRLREDRKQAAERWKKQRKKPRPKKMEGGQRAFSVSNLTWEPSFPEYQGPPKSNKSTGLSPRIQCTCVCLSV